MVNTRIAYKPPPFMSTARGFARLDSDDRAESAFPPSSPLLFSAEARTNHADHVLGGGGEPPCPVAVPTPLVLAEPDSTPLAVVGATDPLGDGAQVDSSASAAEDSPAGTGDDPQKPGEALPLLDVVRQKGQTHPPSSWLLPLIPGGAAASPPSALMAVVCAKSRSLEGYPVLRNEMEDNVAFYARQDPMARFDLRPYHDGCTATSLINQYCGVNGSAPATLPNPPAGWPGAGITDDKKGRKRFNPRTPIEAVTGTGEYGRTPLHHAAQYCGKVNSGPVILYLISQGSDARKVDEYGLTPLHCAALNTTGGGAEAIESLLSYGVDINARTSIDPLKVDLADTRALLGLRD